MDIEAHSISRTLAVIMGYSISPLDLYQTPYHPNVIHFWQMANERLSYDTDLRLFIIKNYSRQTLDYYSKVAFQQMRRVPFGIELVY